MALIRISTLYLKYRIKAGRSDLTNKHKSCLHIYGNSNFDCMQATLCSQAVLSQYQVSFFVYNSG